MRLLLTVLFCAVVTLSCGGDRTQQRRQEQDAGVGCGNGVLEEGEACDGSDFGSKTCQTEGFESGTLNCSATCELLTTSCVKRCGNGQLDTGEQCDGDAGRPVCSDFGFGACTAACTKDLSHCINDPLEFGTGMTQSQGAGTFLSDLPPAGFGDLVTAVPQPGYLETFRYSTTQGFVSDRKLSTGKRPLWTIVGQFDGVAGLDLATIDADTSVDRFRYTPASFPRELISPTLDGGTSCKPHPFVGAAKLDPDAIDDLVFYGCQNIGDAGVADDFVVVHGGPMPVVREIISAGNIITSTLADLDGDSLIDILYISRDAPTELRGYRAAGGAFQPLTARSLSFAPNQIAAADFDGDGDLDLAASDGATVRVFENTGSAMVEKQQRNSTPVFLFAQDMDLDGKADVWFTKSGAVEILRSAGNFTFTPWTETLFVDGGVALNANAADVDGDGDLDIAATFKTGVDPTTTLLLLNRVK